ncbi:MAG: DUF2285 domain-containing protein [Acetobacteraceae bacterium]|nr:DUF2285 domain-containing protein [Acetobacteraceae bacterium]
MGDSAATARRDAGRGGARMTAARILETPPDAPRVTAYDLAHKILYLRLLDAAAEGADWREVARIVLGLDPDRDPDQARRIHDSHLARARWMTEAGYRDLLRQGSTS